MAADTRIQFLETAERLFAKSGFYGVSIAAIADELGLTKQALLHHFGSKEKLYGEVLRRISADFEALAPEPSASTLEPAARLKSYFLRLLEQSGQKRTQILMRELLDNRLRAETAGAWYLKGFLETLISMIKDVPGWQRSRDPEALAAIYQILGAINYYRISAPTLTGIFGSDAIAELNDVFPAQLERLIDATLSMGRRQR